MQGNRKVFISYSSKDADLVERLKAALMAAGIAVWIDHEQLTPDTLDWQEAVRKGILQATMVIYIASPSAASSRYVIHEIEMARGEGKPVIAFWLRGEKWYDCAPMGWYSAQYTDGRGTAYADGLEKLLATLGGADSSSSPLPPFQSTYTAGSDSVFDVGHGAETRALPIYLLLDCSADMAGAPIEALREGMQMLYDELMSDQQMRRSAKLSFIIFGDGASQTPLVSIKDIATPILEAFGSHRGFEGALHLLNLSIDEDVVRPTSVKLGDYRPLVFIFLGGAISGEWRSEVRLLRDRALIIGLGVGPDYDAEALAEICGDRVFSSVNISGPTLHSLFYFNSSW